jgi:hypothetical protein
MRKERERSKEYEDAPFRPRHATSRTLSVMRAATGLRGMEMRAIGWPGLVAESRGGYG